ncbi:MAG: hypothetical protein IJ309_00510 [Clostridia bacterium]|nr:hypothetical protein [Clostridia bacterium]
MANKEHQREYKRAKKQLHLSNFIFILLIAGSVVAGLFINEYIFIATAVLFLIWMIYSSGLRTSIKRSFCPKCKAHYNYDEDIDWDVVGEEISSSGQNNRVSQKLTVEFSCTCPECDHEMIFTKKFTTASVDDMHGYQGNSLDDQARKFFWSK